MQPIPQAQYNFKKDFASAYKVEKEVADYICKKYKMNFVDECHDGRYDFSLRNIDGRIVTFEIKCDAKHAETGNIGLEFESWGRPAGISISQADFYCYKVFNHDGTFEYHLIRTSTLKKMIEDELYFRIVCGGDVGSNSMNYLFKDYVFYKHTKRIK